MKCHYIKCKHGRVLIPGCWGPVHSLDIEDCYCAFSERNKEQNDRLPKTPRIKENDPDIVFKIV